MIEAIKEYGKQITKSGLSRREKTIALKSTISRTIAYAALATTLTETEGNRINKELRKAAISGLGIAKTTPIELIYGPRKENGFEIPDFNTTQLCEHLKTIIDNLEDNTITGRLLRHLIEDHQIELGTMNNIWEIRDARIINSLTDTWIKRTIKEMRKHNITIRSTGDNLKIWRRGDQCIMDLIRKAPGYNFDMEQIRRIQEVRKHLRVITIADILIEDRIDVETWNGSQAIGSISKDRYHWPKSEQPDEQEIAAWQTGLKAIGIQGPNWTTTNTLGSWYSDIWDKFEGWISKDDRYIKTIEHGKITIYKYNEINKRNKRTEYQRIEDDHEHKQAEWERARVIQQDNKSWILERIKSWTKRIEDKIDTQRWAENITNLDDENTDRFRKKLEEGTANIVVDASDNKKGVLACAFVEELDEQDKHRQSIEGIAQIPSRIQDANSYRGELGGILQATRFLCDMEKIQNIMKGTCTIKCDNKRAIETAKKITNKRRISCKESCFDIIKMLHREIAKSKIKFEFKWVKGHQDRDIETEQLNDEAKANCKADELAGRYTETLIPEELPQKDTAEGPYITINNTKLHANIEENIREHIHSTKLDTYWRKRGRYRGSRDKVDWTALKNANKKFTWEDQMIITKSISGWGATSKTMFQRNLHADPICPLCSKEIETTRHNIQCTNEEMEAAFLQQIQDIRKRYARRNQKHGEILERILKQYRRDSRYNETLQEIQQQLKNDQMELGASSIIDGIFHVKWRLQGYDTTDIQNMIIEIFRLRIKMWKTRNEIFKRNEEDIQTKRMMDEKYNSLIETAPTNMMTIDVKRYTKTKEEFSTMSLRDKQRWITTAQGIKNKYNKWRNKRGLHNYGFQGNRQTITSIMTRRKRKREDEIKTLQKWIQNNTQRHLADIRERSRTIATESELEQNEWILETQRAKKTLQSKEQTKLTKWIKRDKEESHKTTEQKQTKKRGRITIHQRIDKRRRTEKLTKWLVRTEHNP